MSYDKKQFDAMVAGLNAQDIPGVNKVSKPRLRAGQVLVRIMAGVAISMMGLMALSAASLVVWGITAIWGAILS